MKNTSLLYLLESPWGRHFLDIRERQGTKHLAALAF